jgi:hypothetical protein
VAQHNPHLTLSDLLLQYNQAVSSTNGSATTQFKEEELVPQAQKNHPEIDKRLLNAKLYRAVPKPGEINDTTFLRYEDCVLLKAIYQKKSP